MRLIAYGLESGNPVAYMLIFLILYPSIMFILYDVIEWIKKKRK